MTFKRILSGAVFFAILLTALFVPVLNWVVPILCLVAAIKGVWEFSHFGQEHPPMSQLALSMIAGAALLLDGFQYHLAHALVIIGGLTVLTLAASLWLQHADVAAVACRSVASPIYVALPLAFVLRIWHDNLGRPAQSPNAGAHYLLFVILVTWSSDTGAYFAGRWFGKHRIVPRISPGKTLEGYIGGVVMTIAVAVAMQLTWNNIYELFTWRDVIVLAAAFSVIAPIGDLAESALKRSAHLKDSGVMLPGHGGMLDIIDSLLFTTIFYYLYLSVVYPDVLPTP